MEKVDEFKMYLRGLVIEWEWGLRKWEELKLIFRFLAGAWYHLRKGILEEELIGRQDKSL